MGNITSLTNKCAISPFPTQIPWHTWTCMCHTLTICTCSSAPSPTAAATPPPCTQWPGEPVNSCMYPPSLRMAVYPTYRAAVCGLPASASPLLQTLRWGCFFIVSLLSAVKQGAGGCSGLATLRAEGSPESATTPLQRASLNSSTPTFLPRSLCIIQSRHPGEFEPIVPHDMLIHGWK